MHTFLRFKQNLINNHAADLDALIAARDAEWTAALGGNLFGPKNPDEARVMHKTDGEIITEALSRSPA